MVNVIPFLPSFRRYAGWLGCIRGGMSEEEAVKASNLAVGAEGKCFSRTHILSGGREISLSIPIVGGSSRLRRASGVEQAVMSDHGNWRHVHLGALEAAYGRMPFYQEIIPSIRDCYFSDSVYLADFNSALDRVVRGFLIPDGKVPPGEIHPAALQRGEELLNDIRPEISIIDGLMRHGPVLLLPLLAFTSK